MITPMAIPEAINGNGNGSVFSLVGIIKQLGPITVIALFLVWKLTGSLDTIFDRFNATDTRMTILAERMNTMDIAHTLISDTAVRTNRIAERTLWVMRLQCVQNANTSEQRRDCMTNGPETP